MRPLASEGPAEVGPAAHLRAPGAVLLVSTYELGHAPHGIALPAAFLERAGYLPTALDLAVEPLDALRVRAARLVALSVPMHTALRLGLDAARRIRALNPEALLCFHGLYAPLNADLLLAAGAAAVLGGECEEELVELAAAVERGADLARFVHRSGADAPRRRLDYPVPSRAALPPLDRYARLEDAAGEARLAGYTEATRGCKHLCRHCPIPPIYRGRFFAVPEEVVVEDVARQVAAGAAHVTFGDPDFLNGPTHALRVARAVHARFPALTFDFTAKVEHLVRREPEVTELRALGAVLVTTAVESLSDRVLAKLDKGHTREEALAAFELCERVGVALRPSLVPFTPWATLEDYLDLVETLGHRGWLHLVDPVQLSIRLLVPPGSLLLDDPELRLGGLDAAALTWRWAHPDPRMDRLQREVAAVCERAAAAQEPRGETLARIHGLALAADGRPHERAMRPAERRSPRLTESWFC